uniref:hypothetical protein n=1 Tax=Sphingomonas populi TaxID=2484750 RepID=UPI001E638FBE|nr:hypothetical protein [Sphingomonas populi]
MRKSPAARIPRNKQPLKLSGVFFRRGTMLIRAGYTLAFECDAATPLIAMLNIHPSRLADLPTPYEMSTGATSDRED